jgi:DNA repair exonuclease SbcCD nuclease subunit
MINDAENEGVKYAYFCGDLFHVHGSIPTQALVIASRLFKSLRERGIQIRAIPGNHDMYDRLGTIHALSMLSDEETQGKWDDDGLMVHALPYTTDEEKLKRFLGELAWDYGECGGGMVMLHQGVAGVPLSSGFVLDERLTPDMIPDNVRAFTGHYHFHRAVTPNLTVVGNLTALNWGDIDQNKGWVIWNDWGADESETMEWKHQTKAPHFINYCTGFLGFEGNFVRYNNPVDVKEQSELRASLIKNGALTVEFPTVKVDKQQSTVRTGDEITIEHVVEQFENQTEGRRREVGVEVREENYAPQD